MNNNEKTLDISQVVALQEDYGSELPVSAMLAKSGVPFSHRRIADNYVMIKRIYGFQIVQPRITNSERNLLFSYNFNTLENTTISQVNNELAMLKQWAVSIEDNLRKDADELLQIRVKELKFILSNKYAVASNELYNGYKAIDVYLSEMAKFYSIN